MVKLVIVEGPDGGGKSTLVKTLLTNGYFTSLHTGGPPSSRAELQERVVKINEAIRTAPGTLILDRHPAISDPIYSKVTGSRAYMTSGELWDSLRGVPFYLVYCRGTPDSMRGYIDRTAKYHKPPGHLMQVIQHHGEVVKLYDAFFKKTPHIPFDWQKDSVLSLANKLVSP